MSMMQNDNDAKWQWCKMSIVHICQLYIYVNVAKCQCFSVSAIYQTIFDLRKGIEQVLQVFFFFQSIYRLKCWYLSEWQLVLSWQFFSWLWSFYIVSKRKPVVVDWILQANTNRQILKGKVFLKEQKRVTCLCRVSQAYQVMCHFLKTVGGLFVKQLPCKFAVNFFCRLDSSRKHKPSDIKRCVFKEGKSRKKVLLEWFKLTV